MILGGPGSGKGTQSNTPRLEYYDYRQRLLRVDGNQTSDDVKRDILLGIGLVLAAIWVGLRKMNRGFSI
ncbi:MAG: hypothetical protein AAFO59_04760 [Cyanobacteria bacterium J06607_17]